MSDSDHYMKVKQARTELCQARVKLCNVFEITNCLLTSQIKLDADFFKKYAKFLRESPPVVVDKVAFLSRGSK